MLTLMNGFGSSGLPSGRSQRLTHVTPSSSLLPLFLSLLLPLPSSASFFLKGITHITHNSNRAGGGNIRNAGNANMNVRGAHVAWQTTRAAPLEGQKADVKIIRQVRLQNKVLW